MGKEEDERPAVSGRTAPPPGSGGEACRSCVTWRCVAVTLLGLAVLLSAVFWLPPFGTWHRGVGGTATDDTIGADIMASFRLERTVSELRQNISKLEYDIYSEIGIPGSIVSVTSLEPLINKSDYSVSLNGSDNSLNGSGYTNVTFSIFPYPKNTSISPTWISILRSSFVSLVIQQSTLHLTGSLFGNSSSFEVLKFPGGITIIPPQSAFLLIKPHAFFNFTLNFPICEVEGRTEELKEQMKMGLVLNSYENLFIKLTNLEGSTVNSSTIIQTSIILQVGNHQRLRQLAQTITNSSSSHSNLGLNHTTFGRVKQISLSSYLRHSLSNTPTPSPVPAPAPSVDPVRNAPSPSPVPSVDPVHGAPAPAPKAAGGCRFGRQRAPANEVPGPGPANEVAPPGVAPVRGLGGVSFEHVHPPSESERRREKGGRGFNRVDSSPSLPPQPSSAFVSHMVKTGWVLAPLFYLLLQ